MSNKFIYLDNNATTRPLESVVDAYAYLSLHSYYNINTSSFLAKEIRDKIDEASLDILKIACLNPDTFGVIYTSSSTEVNKGIISLFGQENVITTPYEHKSILGCLSNNRNILKLDKANGVVTPEELDRTLGSLKKKDNVLVSIMAANNEFPVRNDIEALGRVVKKYPGVRFHTDATQLFGKGTCHGFEYADLVNFSTHKFHGLKGVGILLYRKSAFPDTEKFPFVMGTPNSTAILAHAPLWKHLLEKKHGSQDEKYFDLRIHLLTELQPLGAISLEPDDCKFLNPGTCLLSFPGICNLLLKKHLDDNGVIVSIGSACDTKKKGASDTIKSLGLLGYNGIIRVSFSEFTTIEELDRFVKILKKILPLSRKDF